MSVRGGTVGEVWVVRCVRVVPPDRVTALYARIQYSDACRQCKKMKSRQTLIHILALPDQLWNSLRRSLREKNRSSTGGGNDHQYTIIRHDMI